MKMNEQFSRLYHLAWNYSEFDDEYQEKPTYERRCVVQSRIFAELIVRECLGDFKDRIATRYQGSDKDRDIAYGMEIVYDNIIDKFGVEE